MSNITATRLSAHGGTIHAFVKSDKQIMLQRLGLLRPGTEIFLTEEEYADPGVQEAVITAEDIARRQEEERLEEMASQEELMEKLRGESEDGDGEEDEAARGPGSIRGRQDRMIAGRKRGGQS